MTFKNPKYCFRLPSIGIQEKHFNVLPFGQQVNYLREIQKWKETAKTIHVSQKHRSTFKAIREFKELYQPKEYFYIDRETHNYRDDSIELYYK